MSGQSVVKPFAKQLRRLVGVFVFFLTVIKLINCFHDVFCLIVSNCPRPPIECPRLNRAGVKLDYRISPNISRIRFAALSVVMPNFFFINEIMHEISCCVFKFPFANSNMTNFSIIRTCICFGAIIVSFNCYYFCFISVLQRYIKLFTYTIKRK